jgi:hypothetical protein
VYFHLYRPSRANRSRPLDGAAGRVAPAFTRDLASVAKTWSRPATHQVANPGPGGGAPIAQHGGSPCRQRRSPTPTIVTGVAGTDIEPEGPGSHNGRTILATAGIRTEPSPLRRSGSLPRRSALQTRRRAQRASCPHHRECRAGTFGAPDTWAAVETGSYRACNQHAYVADVKHNTAVWVLVWLFVASWVVAIVNVAVLTRLQ